MGEWQRPASAREGSGNVPRRLTGPGSIVSSQQRKPHANKALVYSLSFFSWLVFCLLAQGLKYLEHRKRSDGEGSGSEEDVPHLFEDETTTTHNADEERAGLGPPPMSHWSSMGPELDFRRLVLH